jgi:hypothetical protein
MATTANGTSVWEKGPRGAAPGVSFDRRCYDVISNAKAAESVFQMKPRSSPSVSLL